MVNTSAQALEPIMQEGFLGQESSQKRKQSHSSLSNLLMELNGSNYSVYNLTNTFYLLPCKVLE